jgi:hypothetical protein
MKRWCRDLRPGTTSLTARVSALGLAQVEIQPWEDLDDPAGGDVEVVAACARDVLDLTTTLASVLING